MSQPQSQPSSQQSYTMSQPQSQSQFSRHQLPDHPKRNGQDLPRIIYKAVYSGVDVYEMEVNQVIVMRRRNDSWLNATQILKVARIDKGKRTKILEKEIQTGEHEKVQGGYGKYQGTWIRFERGVEVCKQYHVEELLRPLLTYDMGQDGGVAGRGDLNTPTKEQAMAAQRKRMYSAGNDGRSNGMPGTFFKNISSTASNAVAAISKARFDSPGPRSRNGPTRPPSFSRQSSMQNADDFPGNSQQSYASEYSQTMDPVYSTQNTHILPSDEPPRKRQRIVTPAESYGYASQSMEMYANNYPGSPTEPNDSFVYAQAGISMHDPDANFLPPLPFDMSPEAERKRNLLMNLFLDRGTNETDNVPIGALQSLSPIDLDTPIDASSNTALHWAATLARMSLLRALISAGANPCRVNASGETALMRASAVTNNSEQVSFPELLDVLGNTIDIRDKRGRTVLHHIALSSAVKGRSHSSRYYLESLLEWVVRHGSAPSSQTTVANGVGGAAVPKMSIGRFMSEIVNAQDKSGDTALGIASRVGNRSIISQLLEVGADPNIANAAGLRPSDFGVGVEAGESGQNGDVVDGGSMKVAGNNNISRESSDDVISSISHLLNETSNGFQVEMKKKQTDLDSLHATLRSTSTQLNDARRTLESLQAAAKSQLLTRQKVFNLTRGREEEQKRLAKIEQSQGPLDGSSISWEADLQSLPELGSQGERRDDGSIPSATVLRARIQALKNRTELTRTGVASLKSRSKDIEIKYRKVVALCTGTSEDEVDTVLDSLVRAVESEKGELEVSRVRRFLGGVDTIA
ncbi:hypothetical protein GGR51DRAFT_546500 [Nemania sp. FL0031]|nr:hypothetical protein GGR51DRAFT_546500 [Nemania sp. FL0031]